MITTAPPERVALSFDLWYNDRGNHLINCYEVKNMEWIILRRRVGALCIIVGILTIFLAPVMILGESYSAPAFTLPDEPTLIIDPGHGGEDGGAVAEDGTQEAEINLAVALRLNAAARLCGVHTVLTRSTAQISYPDNAAGIAEKKAADQKQRVETIHAVPNGLMISIHQNFYPAASPRGAQVLYANTGDSCAFGTMLHTHLIQALDPDNRRVAAPISDDIYLMKHVQCPAVLVECGFLSNPEELKLLRDSAYELKLGLVMLGSFLEYTQTGWNQ